MKKGDTIKYRNYEIVKTDKENFGTVIYHDSLKDAKRFIDRLIGIDEIIGEEEWAAGVTS